MPVDDPLVPFEGIDFLVRPYASRAGLLPGSHYRRGDGTRLRFEAITGDPQRHGRGRVRVTDPDTGRTTEVEPARAGLSVLAVVDGTHESARPHGGDAIRLAAAWRWGGEAIGALGVLDGHIDRAGQGGSVCFNTRAHRDRVGGWVSCSGGPATIHTEDTEFTATPDTVLLPVWDWGHNHPGADMGVDYLVRVRVWSWSPTT